MKVSEITAAPSTRWGAFVAALVSGHRRECTPKERIFFKLLVFFLFFGRAWQALLLELPLRDLLWDERLMTGVVEAFGYTWDYYVRHSDAAITHWQMALGALWALAALCVWWLERLPRWLLALYWLATAMLVFLAVLYGKEMFWAWGQFWEYSLQMSAPVFLYFVLRKGATNTPNLRFWLQISIGITFFSHGLYAYGYYPQPVAWVDWCIFVFRMSEPVAREFLVIIGILDFAKLFLIFVPLRPLQWAALWYCVLWGFITALARIVANFYGDMMLEHTLYYYLPETLLRLVHGGIPLLLWSLWRVTSDARL